MQNPTSTWSGNKLEELFADGAKLDSIRLVPNSTFAAGTVLGQIVLAALNSIQTLTGTATGGTFTLTYTQNGVAYTTTALAAESTAAQIQAALAALAPIGVGQIACTGGPLATGTVACQFQGLMQGIPIGALTVQTGNLTGGTVTIAQTQTGVAYGRYNAYNSALIANPAAAPVISNGAAGTWPAGDYNGQYAFVNSLGGETLPSPVADYAQAGNFKIHFAALAGIPTGVTAVNYYVNAEFVIQQPVVANAVAAFDIDYAAAQLVSGIAPKRTSNATVAQDGTQNGTKLLTWDVTTDDRGNIILGYSQNTPEWGVYTTTEAYYAGTFKASRLVGADANLLQGGTSPLLRLLSGSSITDPNAIVRFL